MKQQITEKQLNDLSKSGQEKLLEWWKPKEGDFIVDLSNPTHTFCFWPHTGGLGKNYLPILSIGQMIEFLEDYANQENYGEWVKFGLSKNKDWNVFMAPAQWSKTDKKLEFSTNPHPELCDALWEAVKEAFNERRTKNTI